MTHVAERTCSGCRSKRPRPALLRLARQSQDCVTLDATGRMTGRGAYLCIATAVSCLEAAQRRQQLARSLRVDHGVIDYSELKAQIERHLDP